MPTFMNTQYMFSEVGSSGEGFRTYFTLEVCKKRNDVNLEYSLTYL